MIVIYPISTNDCLPLWSSNKSLPCSYFPPCNLAIALLLYSPPPTRPLLFVTTHFFLNPLPVQEHSSWYILKLGFQLGSEWQPVLYHDSQEEEMEFELDLEGMEGFRQKWTKNDFKWHKAHLPGTQVPAVGNYKWQRYGGELGYRHVFSS